MATPLRSVLLPGELGPGAFVGSAHGVIESLTRLKYLAAVSSSRLTQRVSGQTADKNMRKVSSTPSSEMQVEIQNEDTTA